MRCRVGLIEVSGVSESKKNLCDSRDANHRKLSGLFTKHNISTNFTHFLMSKMSTGFVTIKSKTNTVLVVFDLRKIAFTRSL